MEINFRRKKIYVPQMWKILQLHVKIGRAHKKVSLGIKGNHS